MSLYMEIILSSILQWWGICVFFSCFGRLYPTGPSKRGLKPVIEIIWRFCCCLIWYFCYSMYKFKVVLRMGVDLHWFPWTLGEEECFHCCHGIPKFGQVQLGFSHEAARLAPKRETPSSSHENKACRSTHLVLKHNSAWVEATIPSRGAFMWLMCQWVFYPLFKVCEWKVQMGRWVSIRTVYHMSDQQSWL